MSVAWVYPQNSRDSLYVPRIVSVATILGVFVNVSVSAPEDILGYARYLFQERGVLVSAF